MRKLLKGAYKLSKTKGTKYAIYQICDILLGERPIILEKCFMNDSNISTDRATYESLYGSSSMGFTVLINKKRDERLYAQLKFLIDQVKPVRSVARIVFLGENGNLDRHCYLDFNAQIMDYKESALGQDCYLGKNLKMN